MDAPLGDYKENDEILLAALAQLYDMDAHLQDHKKTITKNALSFGKALAAADEVDSAKLVNLPFLSKIEGYF